MLIGRTIAIFINNFTDVTGPYLAHNYGMKSLKIFSFNTKMKGLGRKSHFISRFGIILQDVGLHWGLVVIKN